MFGSVGNVTRLAMAASVLICFALASASTLRAEDVRSDIGPKVGDDIGGMIALPDQAGIRRDFVSLSGKAGLIVVFSRSLSWCPFCKTDAKQWSGVVKDAGDRGFNIAIVTYDAGDALAAFADRFNIQFPLLSDEGSHLISKLGILNQENAPGSFAYGVPHPMAFVINAKGVLKARFSEASYTDRADKNDVLAAAARIGAPAK